MCVCVCVCVYIYIYIYKTDASGSRAETLGKFSNVVLEKDGKAQLDRSCEKIISIISIFISAIKTKQFML